MSDSDEFDPGPEFWDAAAMAEVDQGVEGDRSTVILKTPEHRSPEAPASASDAANPTPRTKNKLDELGKRFRKVLDDLTISQDAHLTNVRRLKETLEPTRLYTIRERPSRANIERSIASVLSTSQLPGRKVIMHKKPSVQKGFQTWKMEFKDTSGSTTFFGGQLATLQVGFALVPSDQRKVAEQLAQFIADWFNRWPSPTTDLETRRCMVSAAVDYFLPSSRKAIARPRWEASKKNSWYIARVWRIDPITHKAEKRLLTIAPNQRVLENAREAPDLPDRVVLFDWVKSGSKTYFEKDATGQWPSVIPDPLPEGQLAKAHALVVKFLYFVIPKLDGIVASEERVIEIYGFWKQKFGFSTGNDRNPTLGPYGGQHLLSAFRNKAQRSGNLRIGPLFAKDIGFPDHRSLPLISIRSLLGMRIALPLDLAYREWFSGGEPRIGWLASGDAADKTNDDIAEGRPPMGGCDCSAAQALEEVHPCAICFQLVLCDDLRRNAQGARVCQAHVLATIDYGVVEQVLKRSLRVNLSNELRQHGEDPFSEENMKLFNDALPEVLASIVEGSNGTQYIESYGEHKVSIPAEVDSHVRSIHPDICSVDAVMLRAPTGDGRYKGHVLHNLAVTRAPNNMFKWAHLPAWLALAAEWMRLAPKERTLARAKEFMARVDELHLVMIQIPYFVKGRGHQETTDQEYAHQLAQFVSGRVFPDERATWERKAYKITSESIPPVVPDNERSYIWSKKIRASLTKLAKQSEKRFGIKLQWSADNCPYPGLNGFMEKLWSWNAAAVFSRERRERLRILCNRRHATTVNEYQMFASLIKSGCIVMACLQGNCPDPESHGPAHFPFRLAIRHPLRVAFGHLHHKAQMTFEWLQEVPDDIEKVDTALNNILIEPSTSNWLRWDYDEKYWPQMFKNLAACTVKPQWFNPNADPMDTDSPRNVADLVYEPDAFQGLEFELDEEEAEADARAHPDAYGLASKSASGPARRHFALASTDYAGIGELEGDTGLVPPAHMMYGRVVVAGQKRGFARVDGTFRTADDEIVGAFMHIGTNFQIFGHLARVDSPLPYLGALIIRKVLPNDQVSSMVGNDSVFYGYVLVNRGLDKVGHATSNQNFVAMVNGQEEVLGTFDEATGDIFDNAGALISNIAQNLDAPIYLKEDKEEADLGKPAKVKNDKGEDDPDKSDNGGEGKSDNHGEKGAGPGPGTGSSGPVVLRADMFSAAYGEYSHAKIVTANHPLYGVILYTAGEDIWTVSNPGLADNSGRFAQPLGNHDTIGRWVQEDPEDPKSRYVITARDNGMLLGYVGLNEKGAWALSKP